MPADRAVTTEILTQYDGGNNRQKGGTMATNRVLGRVRARELKPEEIERITASATNCTFRTTHIGNIIDDLVDDCGP